MRILRIHSWDGKEEGGGETYIRTVSRMLEARGHPQRIVALTDHPTEYFGSMGVNLLVPRMSPRRAVADATDTPGLEELLQKQCEEFRPDLLHLHHFDAGFASIGRFLSHSQIPLVFTAHDAELVCPISTLVLPSGEVCEGGVLPRCGFTGCRVGLGLPYNLVQNWMFNTLVAPHVRGYFCPSNALRQLLDQNGYRPALHLPSFATIPEDVRRGETLFHEVRQPRIGFLGRIEENKGVEDLLRALPIILRRIPAATLDLAGHGGAVERFKKMAWDLGVSEKITWTGWVTGAQKEEWFRKQHLLVFPSRPFENFPLVALESLVRQVPVVASDAGGARDIVRPGETGWLVPHSEPSKLAEAIVEALEKPQEAVARAERGRKMVLSEFTPEIHVDRLLKGYELLLKQGSLDGANLTSPQTVTISGAPSSAR
jgi:glycosyltransferase involved in cell wall biosynthesis